MNPRPLIVLEQSRMRRPIVILSCSAFVIVALVSLGVFLKRTTSPVVIATTGGEPLQIAPLKTPHFMQTDPGWAKEQIGGSREPLSKVGCTICCVAMVLNAYGVELTPHELNEALKQADGYTKDGLLKWDSVARVSNGKVRAAYIGAPNTIEIENALRNGQPVIAKVMLRNIVQHWVLIVGKNGTEYLVRDPLNPEITNLSAVAHNLYAIRILKPVTD
jgi:hypothetical protein